MTENTNVVEGSDILKFAETIGYKYSDAYTILNNDNIFPYMEQKSTEYCIAYFKYDLEDTEWTEDTIKIMLGFMEHNKFNDITII
jgi:hypothetical protein